MRYGPVRIVEGPSASGVISGVIRLANAATAVKSAKADAKPLSG